MAAVEAVDGGRDVVEVSLGAVGVRCTFFLFFFFAFFFPFLAFFFFPRFFFSVRDMHGPPMVWFLWAG